MLLQRSVAKNRRAGHHGPDATKLSMNHRGLIFALELSVILVYGRAKKLLSSACFYAVGYGHDGKSVNFFSTNKQSKCEKLLTILKDLPSDVK